MQIYYYAIMRRAFSVVGKSAWNALPVKLRSGGLGGVVGLTLPMARGPRFASRILPTVQRPWTNR